MTVLPKRFYKTVGMREGEKGIAILLDERPVRTPLGAELAVPSSALAALIAGEWQAQDERIRPQTMPMTGYANSTIDHVCGAKSAVIERIAAYLPTDLVLFRAEAPDSLRRREERHWDPPLRRMEEEHGIVLRTGIGIAVPEQDPRMLMRFRDLIGALDSWSLAVLDLATALAGSAVLGLALHEDAIDEAAFFEAAFVDELYQADLWGADHEAEARRASLRGEIRDILRFRDALRARA